MVRYPSNLITGRQLRAARVLAGLTQRTLGQALGKSPSSMVLRALDPVGSEVWSARSIILATGQALKRRANLDNVWRNSCRRQGARAT